MAARISGWMPALLSLAKLRAGLLVIGDLVIPEGEDVAVGVGDHRHDAPRLLRGLGDEADAPVMQESAEVEQLGHVEGQAGVAAHHRLGVGVGGGMHAQMRLPLQELGAEGALPDEREAEGIAVEGDRALDVGDEDRDAVESRSHGDEDNVYSAASPAPETPCI